MKSFLVVIMMLFTMTANAITINVDESKKQQIQVDTCRFNVDYAEINCPALVYDDEIVLSVKFYNMNETLTDFEFDLMVGEYTVKDDEHYRFSYKNNCIMYDDRSMYIACMKMEIVDSFCTIDSNMYFSNVVIHYSLERDKWIIKKPIFWNIKEPVIIFPLFDIIKNIGNNSGSSSSSSSSSYSSSSVTINNITPFPVIPVPEPVKPVKPAKNMIVNVNNINGNSGGIGGDVTGTVKITGQDKVKTNNDIKDR